MDNSELQHHIELKAPQPINQPLTGISVKIATKALDVKHTTEVTAKPATCMWDQN